MLPQVTGGNGRERPATTGEGRLALWSAGMVVAEYSVVRQTSPFARDERPPHHACGRTMRAFTRLCLPARGSNQCQRRVCQRARTPATQARTIDALRSLCRFLHTIGYLPVNVALPVKPPAVKNTLAERILSESDVYRLLHRVEGNPRTYALLVLAYASGGRVSELAGLKWRDVLPRGDAGQVTILGEGGHASLATTSKYTHAKPNDSSGWYLGLAEW